MNDEEKIQAGSIPVNPIVDNQEVPPAPAEEVIAPPEDKQTAAMPDENIAKLEKMIADSRSMVGKQSNEIGLLRAKLEELTKTPAGPSEDEQLESLYQKMDTGEIPIEDGMKQAIAITSNLTANKVMSQLSQQRQQEEISKVQGSFLEKNPDYQQLLENGALQPYLKADPLADEYTAYHQYKADERVKALETEYQAKIAAAKEEGAKLAKGAESAGKVLGRQGSTALAPPQPNKPFKNTQEASTAMLETLRQMRSAQAQ